MVDRSTLMGVSPADCPLFFFREHRPIAALREICVAICCNIEEYIRVDQRHRLSPRLSAMIASVVSPLVAVPRIRSKRLGLTVRLPTLRRKARPSSSSSKSTLLPGFIPRRSRTCFGTVTWPLLVTVTVIIASSVIPSQMLVLLSIGGTLSLVRREEVVKPTLSSREFGPVVF